jgi:DNA-binding CsgD family transcriptional regulator
LAEEELDDARVFGGPRAIGCALRTLGLVTGGEEGIGPLQESVAVLVGSYAKLEHARSLVELGAGLRRTNRRAEARQPLADGLDLACRCGARALVQRAREELHAAGSRPRRMMRTGVESLTPSELRVVRMAAAGASNRDIAQELYITPKTVEGHLGHAYLKLDLSGREARGCLGAILTGDLAA